MSSWGGLMASWKTIRLRDVCDSVDYGLTASATLQETGTRFLRITDIVSQSLSWNDVPFVSVTRDQEEKYRVASGDIVIARTGATTGVSRWLGSVPDSAVFASYLVRLKISSKHDSRFIGYALKGDQYWDYVRGVLGDKSAQPNASATTLVAAPLCVPDDIAEQQRIADVLGSLDDKIAINERIRDTTLSLAHSCYESTTASASSERIGDLATLFDGPHATPKKTNSGPWFLSISSLKNGYMDLAESAHLSEEDFPRWTRRVQPQAGDVLFSYETRLGDAALMPPGIRGSLGRRMALLRCNSSSVNGALLLHAYLSSAFQEEIKRRTIHGATVDRLPLKEMPNWVIQLPAEGDRNRLSAQLGMMHDRVIQTGKESRALATLRDTLLPQLMSGKLRVRDAEKIVEDAV
ncbi:MULTISPECIES: restriction endonuclease subunit S [Streptomyces]|uniref:restriction endonuclease subunit S n=1 Tax=Streptomyces TaxID=1883 RepID=UPI00131CCB43|nr:MULTISPECIES: restriction endonuclease subunit S [Streptomyces]